MYTFASGDIYSGDRKHGSRDGFGEYIWATGEKCVGSWVNNKKDGQATITKNDGITY